MLNEHLRTLPAVRATNLSWGWHHRERPGVITVNSVYPVGIRNVFCNVIASHHLNYEMNWCAKLIFWNNALYRQYKLKNWRRDNIYCWWTFVRRVSHYSRLWWVSSVWCPRDGEAEKGSPSCKYSLRSYNQFPHVLILSQNSVIAWATKVWTRIAMHGNRLPQSGMNLFTSITV